MTDNLPTERGPASMSLAAASDIGFARSEMTIQTLGEVVGFAKLMATSALAIPKHLRDNPGACMAVTLDALHLRMSPYLLARQSYFVNDNLAYMAQVFSAAINTAPIMRKRPTVSFSGEGDDRVCTVVLHLVDGDQSTDSPKFSKITPKNSPLWKNDPDQQQSYYTKRAAARRHCPEILLGMMDVEEAQAATAIREPSQGTGMVERLASRPVEVDAPGFNVRSITDATSAALDREFDGDNIPDAPQAAPKRRGRPPKAKPEEFTHHTEEGEQRVPDGSPPPMPYLERKGDETGPQGIADDNVPDVGDGSTDEAATPASEPTMEIGESGSGDIIMESDGQEEIIEDKPDIEPDTLAFNTALADAATFADAKAALVKYRRTVTFLALTQPDRIAVNIRAFERMIELRNQGAVMPGEGADPWVFGLFLQWAERDLPASIAPTFDALKLSPAFKALSDAQQQGLAQGVARAVGA